MRMMRRTSPIRTLNFLPRIVPLPSSAIAVPIADPAASVISAAICSCAKVGKAACLRRRGGVEVDDDVMRAAAGGDEVRLPVAVQIGDTEVFAGHAGVGDGRFAPRAALAVVQA